MNIITKEILSWNIESFWGKTNFYRVKKIPDFFKSSLEYKKNFEPLFFEEFRAQIQRFLEINFISMKGLECNISHFQKKFGKFFFSLSIGEFSYPNFRKGDLLILSKQKKFEKTNEQNVNSFGIILDVVQKKKPELLIETNLKSWRHLLQTNKNFGLVSIKQISNLVNHIKEYLTLSVFWNSSVDFQKLILSFSQQNLSFSSAKKYSGLKKHLNFHFNQSQIDGIIAIFKNTMTLVQGPPGTGKTRTILGIISIILKKNTWKKNSKLYKEINSEKKNFPKENSRWKNINPNALHFHSQNFFMGEILSNRKKKHIKVKPLLKFSKKKRIVVCAPSNAAIDENAGRTAYSLPFQSSRDKIKPYKFLRLGPNYFMMLDHLSLENFSLVWASENDFNIRFRIFSKIFHKARFEIIKKCSVVYTTLACAGYSIMKKTSIDETVIIDEAAQAIELSTLIPLKKTNKKIVLVGDVQQLPATVFSRSSVDFEYDRSLFKRLQLQQYPVWFLETQYRMHPQISSFPARKFYKNGLKDSQEVGTTVKFHALRCFGPMIFFDTCESLEQNHLNQTFSWCNLDEIRLISLLLRALVCLYPAFNVYSIGIIAGYNGQIKEFQDYGIGKKQNFEGQVNTVDGFQGKEKDMIFLSCVRAKMEKGVGFLSDCRRINVAFTRARFGFWIVGNATTLLSDISWGEAVFDAQKRARFFSIRKPMERSNRRLVYWSKDDDNAFSFDGNPVYSISIQLLNYLCKKI